MATKRSHRGFSLIEMVVYVAVLVLLLVVVLGIMTSLSKAARNARAARFVEESASATLERVVRETRRATSIATSTSVLDVNPGTLVLNTTDSGGEPKTVELSVSAGRLRLLENGSFTGYLTSASTSVSSLVFRRFASSTAEGVRVEMTLTSGTSTSFRSESFYASAVIR